MVSSLYLLTYSSNSETKTYFKVKLPEKDKFKHDIESFPRQSSRIKQGADHELGESHATELIMLTRTYCVLRSVLCATKIEQKAVIDREPTKPRHVKLIQTVSNIYFHTSVNSC